MNVASHLKIWSTGTLATRARPALKRLIQEIKHATNAQIVLHG